MIIWTSTDVNRSQLTYIDNMRCSKLFYWGMKIHPERSGLIVSQLKFMSRQNRHKLRSEKYSHNRRHQLRNRRIYRKTTGVRENHKSTSLRLWDTNSCQH